MPGTERSLMIRASGTKVFFLISIFLVLPGFYGVAYSESVNEPAPSAISDRSTLGNSDAVQHRSAKEPVKVDPEKLAGKGLEAFPPSPNPPAGSHGHALAGADVPTRVSAEFGGDILVQVVEISGPRTNQVVNVYYDEFIHILEGGLILTNEEGVAHEFGPGDSLVVPKGFSGTWENTGDVFRELIVTETKTFEEDMQRMME